MRALYIIIMYAAIADISFANRELTLVKTLSTLVDELSMTRMSLICKFTKSYSNRLLHDQNFTLNIVNSLEIASMQKHWLSGNGIICLEDFGWKNTSQFIASASEIGVSNTWIVLHETRPKLYLIDLRIHQRLFFVNLKTGRMHETYQTGQSVREDLGPVSQARKVLKGNYSFKQFKSTMLRSRLF